MAPELGRFPRRSEKANIFGPKGLDAERAAKGVLPDRDAGHTVPLECPASGPAERLFCGRERHSSKPAVDWTRGDNAGQRGDRAGTHEDSRNREQDLEPT